MKNKKLFFIFVSIFILSFNAWSAMPYSLVSVKAATNGINNRLCLQDRLRVAEMRRFVNMTANEYGLLRGKRLNFFERISFRLSQHRMKAMLKSYDGDGPDTLQKISWFFKGLILGPIAVILGYLFLKDDERELIKWIWFGFIGFTALVIIILLTL